jgi:hypothetical protein
MNIKVFFIRLAGYSVLFLLSILMVNIDHATPGADEPVTDAPFWAVYKILYAFGLMLAIGGFFEKVNADKSGGHPPPRLLFVVPGVILFFLGMKLQDDAGQFQAELWYTYFTFFLYGFFILSLYRDILKDKK